MRIHAWMIGICKEVLAIEMQISQITTNAMRFRVECVAFNQLAEKSTATFSNEMQLIEPSNSLSSFSRDDHHMQRTIFSFFSHYYYSFVLVAFISHSLGSISLLTLHSCAPIANIETWRIVIYLCENTEFTRMEIIIMYSTPKARENRQVVWE